VGVADILCFLWRGRQTQMGGATEVLKHFTPGRVVCGTAAMAFVYNDQIEEIRGKLSVNLLPLFLAGDRLIQSKVDFVVPFNFAIGDLVHHFAKRSEVLLHGLIDENIAVGQEQDAFLCLGLPHTPNDLERGVSFARAGGHHQQHALLAFGNRFDGTIDGYTLVVAGLPATAISVERLFN